MLHLAPRTRLARCPRVVVTKGPVISAVLALVPASPGLYLAGFELIWVPRPPRRLCLLAAYRLTCSLATSTLSLSHSWIRSEPLPTDSAGSLSCITHGDTSSPLPILNAKSDYLSSWRVTSQKHSCVISPERLSPPYQIIICGQLR